MTIVKDHINRIEAEIIYNPAPSGGYLKSLKSKLWGGSSKPKMLPDTIQIIIYQTADSR